jgi:hypothetical protein
MVRSYLRSSHPNIIISIISYAINITMMVITWYAHYSHQYYHYHIIVIIIIISREHTKSFKSILIIIIIIIKLKSRATNLPAMMIIMCMIMMTVCMIMMILVTTVPFGPNINDTLVIPNIESLKIPNNNPKYFETEEALIEPLKPLIISQPEGPSFRVKGHKIEWQNWEFRVGFTPKEGAVIQMAAFADPRNPSHVFFFLHHAYHCHHHQDAHHDAYHHTSSLPSSSSSSI